MQIDRHEYRMYKQFTMGDGKVKPKTYETIRTRILTQIERPAPNPNGNWPTLTQLNRGY